MGLHQKITDRITSEPCDCGADDDHGAEATQAGIDAYVDSLVEKYASGMGLDNWTDGTEATE